MLGATTPVDEQEHCRLAYLEWRERAARQLAREAGPLGRLTHSREQFYPQLDRKHLKVCRRCEETIYPGSRNPETPLPRAHHMPLLHRAARYPPLQARHYASKETRRKR